MDVGAALVADGQAAELAEPRQGALNGLIANDKFCLTRTGRLRLSWPRARVGPRVGAPPQAPGEATHCGGEHAAAHVACPAHGHGDDHRPAALGPGLPAPPAMDGHSARAGRGAGAPDPAGGTPCA